MTFLLRSSYTQTPFLYAFFSPELTSCSIGQSLVKSIKTILVNKKKLYVTLYMM